MNSTARRNTRRRFWRRRPSGTTSPALRGALPWLLGLLILLLFGVFVSAPAAEEATEAAARDALAQAGYGHLEVSGDGQHLRVQGIAEAEGEAPRVAAIARGATCDTFFASRLTCPTGVTVALTAVAAATASGTEPAPTPPSYEAHDLVFTRTAGSITLAGEVPDAESQAQIVRAAHPLFATVDDRLRQTGKSASAHHPWAARRALEVLAKADSGWAQWRDGRLHVQAEAPSAAHGVLREHFGDASHDPRLGQLTLRDSDQTHACDERFKALLSTTQVRFRTGSAEIDKRDRPLLQKLATLTRQCPMTLNIEGHTDKVGDASQNLALSQARAEAVVGALQGLGIDPQRLAPRGYGAGRPIADNATKQGRASNRRIEIHVATLAPPASRQAEEE